METQTWRYGNEDAKQIIEKNIMRPHYEMHAAGYGFKFESDKVVFSRTLSIARSSNSFALVQIGRSLVIHILHVSRSIRRRKQYFLVTIGIPLYVCEIEYPPL